MKASQLRASILQQAVEGKLVPQIPEEGTAADLLESIRAEREALIKAGKIKKAKPLPKITEDEIPFEIPESWEWVRLGDVCTKLTDGTHHSPPNKAKGEYKYITAKNIRRDGIDLTNITYVSSDVHDEIYSRCNPTKGDVLLIKDGATTGVAVVNSLDEEFSLLSSVALIKLPCGIDAKYLVHMFGSTSSQKYIKDDMSGTAITRLTITKLERFPFPLPPLAEQKRIVAKLEELMPLIDAYEKEEEKLSALEKSLPEKLRRSVLQQAVEGKLVPQIAEEGTAAELLKEIEKERAGLIKAGKMKKAKPLPEITEDEIPFEIPESWEWCHFTDIISIYEIKHRKILASEVSKSGKYPVISQGKDLIDGYSNCDDKLIHDTPLVLFGDHTRNVKYIDFKFIVSADGVKLLKPLGINCQYLYYWVLNSANQMPSRGYARHFSRLKGKFFPLPPLAEQKRIVAKVEELMQIIDKF